MTYRSPRPISTATETSIDKSVCDLKYDFGVEELRIREELSPKYSLRARLSISLQTKGIFSRTGSHIHLEIVDQSNRQ